MIVVTKTSSGNVALLDDISEIGYRKVMISAPVPGSNPPQFRSVPSWVAFARYDAGGERKEITRALTLAQAKVSTGLQLARTMIADIAAKEGVSEGDA